MALSLPPCDRECILPPAPDHAGFVWLLYVIEVLIYAVAIVVGVRSLCMALPGFWVGLRRWIATWVAGSEGTDSRRIKAKAQELRQRLARKLAKFIICACLPEIIRVCLRAPFLSEKQRRGQALERFMGPVSLGFAVLIVVKPKLPTRFLDGLNITLSCTRLVHLVFVARTPWSGNTFEDVRLLDCIAQGFQGIVFGNVRVTILLNLLVFTVTTGLQVLGYNVCCSQPLFDSDEIFRNFLWIFRKAPWMVRIQFFTFAGFSVLAWLKETYEHSWAGVTLQTQAAQQQETLAKRLLSGMCDACVYLGPQLDIVRGAEQLGSILGSDAIASSRLVGRKFTQLVVDREVDRVAGFLECSPGAQALVNEEGAAREASREGAESADRLPVSIRTQLRDAFSVVVSVELFHACLMVAGQQVHILGIREEQDRFDASVRRRQLAQGGSSDKARGTGAATVDEDVDSSSCSSSDVEHAGKTAERSNEASEMHAIVSLAEDGFTVTRSTPAFKAVFGLQSGDQAIPLERLLHGGDPELERFERWFDHETFHSSSTQQGEETEEKQLSFRVPGLQHLGVKLSAQCTMRLLGSGHARMTIRSVSWEKCKSMRVREHGRPRPSQKRGEKQPPSPSGTPRHSQAVDFDERDSKGTRERL